ncbi:prepilin peptidase [Methylophaga sp. OBS3]|uniref:prepilin peptidase n=1 Tax=Methylophaga sp. OBS3 TaxID=2991934 RepID=UPI00225A0880|nr:A24 family peptidase [Methylophaga sp. OBS3]MCX4189653.1 A24 family peptidase [Methylophaga sp. OBS3]
MQLSVLAYILGVWLCCCLVTDFRYRKLPNPLMIFAGIIAIASFGVTQASAIGAPILSAVMAMFLAVLLTLPGCMLKMLGAGDVKMLAVMGLLTSTQFMLLSFVFSGLTAGLILTYCLLAQRNFPYLNVYLARVGCQLPIPTLFQSKSLPFGTLLALGGLLMLVVHISGMANMAGAS